MNTPNKLTVLRIFLVPFFIIFLLTDFTIHKFIIADLIFGIASLTDHFDGKIAREKNLITDFGKFADPLADKVLVMSAFMCFVELGFIGSVVVIIMIAREFIVTSVRLVAVNKGKVIAANNWGKIKTISQILSVIIILILQYLLDLIKTNIIPIEIFGNGIKLENLDFIFNITGNIFIWISATFTIISGAIYIWNNREFVKNTD